MMSLVDYKYRLTERKNRLEIRAKELAKEIKAISKEMKIDVTKYLKRWWICNDNDSRKDIIYIDRYDDTWNCFRGWGFGYFKDRTHIEIGLDETLQYWHIPLLRKISIKQVGNIYYKYIYPVVMSNLTKLKATKKRQ